MKTLIIVRFLKLNIHVLAVLHGQIVMEKCEEKVPKVILRGASNAYYPVVKSSIYIPLLTDNFDQSTIEIIDNPIKWQTITEKASKTKENEESFKEFLEDLC